MTEPTQALLLILNRDAVKRQEDSFGESVCSVILSDKFSQNVIVAVKDAGGLH